MKKPEKVLDMTKFILWLNENKVIISTCNDASKSCTNCKFDK